MTLGYSALGVGAAFAPITLVILMLSPHVGARVATVGVRPLLTAGFACSAIGAGLLARLPKTAPTCSTSSPVSPSSQTEVLRCG